MWFVRKDNKDLPLSFRQIRTCPCAQWQRPRAWPEARAIQGASSAGRVAKYPASASAGQLGYFATQNATAACHAATSRHHTPLPACSVLSG
ncbi:Kielin/chordin-like protein [Frankliniella fusca]|uniref:Kielin/chordin-like protein n=1 Tax=Frankliniella fusca TaxID=407009 RepID=A0AAE1GQ87_9NEOP|nr:Kielin/chordin-like protein [Frankliniella fusca]